jgi:hypothetical protein
LRAPIQPSGLVRKLAAVDATNGVWRTYAVPSPLALKTPFRECHCPGKLMSKLSVSLNDSYHFDKEMSLCFALLEMQFRRGQPNMPHLKCNGSQGLTAQGAHLFCVPDDILQTARNSPSWQI